MNIHKVILATAGFGTRLLPATKSTPKALMPVVDKSLLQWCVRELTQAGFTDIIVIHRPEHEIIPRELKTPNALSQHLADTGKTRLLKELEQMDEAARFHLFPIKDGDSGLGNQILELETLLGETPFAVAFVDELCDKGGHLLSEMKTLAETLETSVTAMVGADHDEDVFLVQAATRLEPEAVAGNKGPRFIGRAVFTKELFKALKSLEEVENGYIDLLDGMSVLARHDRLVACQYHGKWWDCGNKLGYLKAIVSLAIEDEELAAPFREFLDSLQRGKPCQKS